MISSIQTYRSLLTDRKALLHFDNGGKYGTTYKEVQITCVNGTFKAFLTDGYAVLATNNFKGLKDAIKWGLSTFELYNNQGENIYV